MVELGPQGWTVPAPPGEEPVLETQPGSAQGREKNGGGRKIKYICFKLLFEH